MKQYDSFFYTDAQVGEIFLEKYILIHLDNNIDKINLLSLMTKKLNLLQDEKLTPDNLDSLSMQEILSSGQLYGMFMREKLEENLEMAKMKFQKSFNKGKEEGQLEETIASIFNQLPKIGTKIESLLSTGNMKSPTGLDLMQNNGFSIIAERLNNIRFWAHLRSIHRGAYFVEMKTTTVRKLLPDSWGFMCPVHTPDGSLCGLLNHLSMGCKIQSSTIKLCQEVINRLMRFLLAQGMIIEPELSEENSLPIVLDGKLLGSVKEEFALELTKNLRIFKSSSENQQLQNMSITYCSSKKDQKLS